MIVLWNVQNFDNNWHSFGHRLSSFDKFDLLWYSDLWYLPNLSNLAEKGNLLILQTFIKFVEYFDEFSNYFRKNTCQHLRNICLWSGSLVFSQVHCFSPGWCLKKALFVVFRRHSQKATVRKSSKSQKSIHLHGLRLPPSSSLFPSLP